MQFNHLKSLDLDPLDTAELSQPWDNVYSTAVYGDAINLDAGTRSTVAVNHVADATAVASMREAINRLPEPTEAVHLWIGGSHSMGHILAAVLDLAAPATVETLHIATLTFSKDNAAEWATLLDAGKIGRLTIICSQYFEKTSTGIYEYAQALLAPRGVNIYPIRSHCKLIAAKLSTGPTVTAEGSANTRSAKTLEQVTLFGSPEVYAFHRDQMERAAGTKYPRIEQK